MSCWMFSLWSILLLWLLKRASWASAPRRGWIIKKTAWVIITGRVSLRSFRNRLLHFSKVLILEVNQSSNYKSSWSWGCTIFKCQIIDDGLGVGQFGQFREMQKQLIKGEWKTEDEAPRYDFNTIYICMHSKHKACCGKVQALRRLYLSLNSVRLLVLMVILWLNCLSPEWCI